MKKLGYLLLISISILSVSCKKEIEFIGPEFIIVDPATFKYTTSFESKTNDVNFDSTSASFKVSFNEKATWTITLVGDSSGAIKTFTGTSQYIDSTSFSWNGSFDYKTKVKLFQNETVTAKLTILGLDTAATASLSIKNALKPFVIINGFNTITEYSNFFISPDTPDEFVVTYFNSTENSPEGMGYVQLTGRDIAPSGEYFLGNFGINNGTVYDKKQVLKEPGMELYLNLFVKGDGSNGTSKLEVQMEELFGDIWSIEIPTKHTGWKYIAIPYSSFPNNWAQDKDPRGKAGVKEANLVKGIGFICSSNPSRNRLNIAIDYPCLTIGKPLLDLD